VSSRKTIAQIHHSSVAALVTNDRIHKERTLTLLCMVSVPTGCDRELVAGNVTYVISPVGSDIGVNNA
jgi:hypothetical protein